MNRQAIFDAGVTGVFQQARPSMNSQETQCAYRGNGGTKCVLGWSIPDHKYNEWLEGSVPKVVDLYNIDAPESKLARILGARTLKDEIFLHEFQKCHDGIALGYTAQEFLDIFARLAREFAEKYELNTFALEEAWQNLS